MEIPESVNYFTGLPDDLGSFLNNELGNCTCAAYYHALQVWNYNILGNINTEADQCVKSLYITTCGYDPNTPWKDPGGDEKTVLTYLVNSGAPTKTGNHKLNAFIQLPINNKDIVKFSILNCGVIYLSLFVPRYIKPENGASPYIWDLMRSEDNTFLGNHAVISGGYDSGGLYVISAGRQYYMTWEFFYSFVYLGYALIDSSWTKQDGKTPEGLTLAALEFLIKNIKY